MTHPFDVAADELRDRLDELVDITFADLQSQFLVLPRGPGFIEFADFQEAYETLKAETGGFTEFTAERLWSAVAADALALVVLRTMLGLSPAEWAAVAESQTGAALPQGAARTLDRRVRQERELFARSGVMETLTGRRARTLLEVAVRLVTEGAPSQRHDMLHRLDKADTADGLTSLQNAAHLHMPYAMLLYERYLGRPYASHRDAVSELVGDEIENAIEVQLSGRGITYRRTRRAERFPGFQQAPDFFVPTEFAPAVIIEAKLTNDDGTARDKVARLLRLAEMRDERERSGSPSLEVVACVDGRGFGVRRQDMRDLIVAARGKVFTFATLDRLVDATRLHEFASA
ncbi:MAG: hypothetical protein OXG61_13880 [Chloroflexi bacterium]|nr:hypothetical protein [Chloroflexota bacterium]